MKSLPALSNIVLFYALPQVLSTFTRSSKRPLLNVAFIHEIGCQKKAEEDVSSPRTPRMSCWDHFAIHSHLFPHQRGFSSKRQGSHLKRPTYFFSSPSTWRHSISPNFFYKPNTAKKTKTSLYKPFSLNDKNSFFLFTKAIMLPVHAILPQRWAGTPQQPITI